MAWLRHSDRHILHSVADYLESMLDSLDWTTPDATPFGAPVVDLRREPAFAGDKLLPSITAGTVAITAGSEASPDPEEMGGPLSLQEIPIFVDVFENDYTIARALATDIRDIFLGRIPGSKRFCEVVNQATGVPVPGWQVEFTDVERIDPDNSLSLRWQTVHVTASTYFPEEVY